MYWERLQASAEAEGMGSRSITSTQTQKLQKEAQQKEVVPPSPGLVCGPVGPMPGI